MLKTETCYFVRECGADDLAPEEIVLVDRTKVVPRLRTRLQGEPRTLRVCSECADRGWDEILGYADEVDSRAWELSDRLHARSLPDEKL